MINERGARRARGEDDANKSLIPDPVAKILNRPAEAFFQLDFRFPVQQRARLGDVRPARLRVVFDALLRLKDDARLIARQPIDGFGKLEDGQFVGVADVDRIVFTAQ